MLLQLTISNFAIVSFLELDLRPGMTSITGETGAGKSIAIDALALALGERADADSVRPGADKADISARFRIDKLPRVKAWLSEQELDEQDECILRRTLSREGRSRGYINGTPVPLSQLKALGALLINIHGQHAHQELQKSDYQRSLLDAYAGHHQLLQQTSLGYQHWRQLGNERRQLQQEQAQWQAQRQLLEYQVAELDELALAEDEFPELEAEHKRLANGAELLNDCQQALDVLADGEETNALQLLRQGLRVVIELNRMDGRLGPVQEMIESSLIQLEEGHGELSRYLDRLELDPERLHEVETRLGKVMELARKHHVPPAELATHHQQLRTRLAEMADNDSRLQELEQEVELARNDFLQAAERLSQSRQRYAESLNGLITQGMHQLSMEHGRFEIRVSADDNGGYSPLGIDRVEFLVSTNPGQPLSPLARVASGGELSRISLAIQVITARKVETPTLIFDEVDVGVSGPTAAVVGKLLRQLGESTQVLVITHLPQVAGNGHQHFFVSKSSADNDTQTRMRELDEHSRLQELARLLGGNKITPNTLANARELLVCGEA
ncbi:DNA repair protein RecN [Zobellella denitrificans]|jgi:DNA repair protein RecN (Recombination protein N)|uniref:DNA repair protein RecN n=1 Tax=Zobellella denitrificans TaxID=347534 RepID=A0A231N4B3_9GAMM|nr:DNA repair protein RecN [Zobellella denitrificans]ATG73282.1 recombination and repair protein [Zobellella denitrificans]OXS16985.1 DNA repair protein RecN [Zobellella denitrificans]